ncbi:unnamed protein product [Prunus brigantina]
MSLPPGYRVTDEMGNVCKLKKALYGLKQSPRAWFGRFTTSMKKFGSRQANTDHTLFIKHKAGKVTLLIIYVDDMIVTGNDTVEIEELQKRVCEILWLRWLLVEIGFRSNAATKLHCDNQSAFEIANNSVQHDRTKHVEVDRHFIKEKLEHKLIYIPFVPSSEQLANMLTHAKRRFEDSLDKLGITDIYAPT